MLINLIKKKKTFMIAITFCLIVIMLSSCNSENKTSAIDKENSGKEKEIEQEKTNNIENNTSLNNYKIIFNEAKNIAIECKNIEPEGHFWEDINEEKMKKVLPIISDKYETKGAVHYTSKDNVAEVYELQCYGRVENLYGDDGYKEDTVAIYISKGEISECEVFEGKKELSDVDGIKVLANVFDPKNESKILIYNAEFTIDDTNYKLSYHGKKEKQDLFASLIVDVIQGGKPDFAIFDNPVIPELKDEELTLEEAKKDKDYGAFVITAPENFNLEIANRKINQTSNYLILDFTNGDYDYLNVFIEKVDVYDDDIQNRIVNISEYKEYDLSLYSIPLYDSVPEELRDIVSMPIFREENLTLDVIKKREKNIENTVKITFSVLYGDILVEIHSSGISAEHLYNELNKKLE